MNSMQKEIRCSDCGGAGHNASEAGMQVFLLLVFLVMIAVIAAIPREPFKRTKRQL